jgi:predicted ferric reductase
MRVPTRVQLREVLLWSMGYLLALALPLFAAYIHRPPGRGFWIEFGVGLGFVGMALMGVQFVLTARFRKVSSPFGTDTLLQFHRQMGIIALLFILAHPAILLIANRAYLEFLDPRINTARTLALIVAVIALVLLIVLSIWRQQVKLSYEWWRLTHGFFGFLVIGIGLVHILQVGHYVDPLWKQALWTGITLVPIALLVHVRVIKPILIKRKPYRVAEVRAEPGDVWTLVLEADGHGGKPFHAGQYMWLTIQPTPFSLQQHPFSVASSDKNPCRPEFTIKELGDFTGAIGRTEAGARVFVEGPYGTFTLDPHFGGGLVFVAGGIGVTPMMGMLRTLRDGGSRREIILIYGNTEHEAIVFADELEAMQRDMNLKVIHVLEEAVEQWEGEVGYITAEVLDRHLPGDRKEDWHYYVCGPGPMMDMVEQALIERDIPLWNVYVERFEMV